MRMKSFTALFLIATAAGLAPAQEIDPQKIVAGLRASYYHPDDLNSISCRALLDMRTLFKQLMDTEDAQKVLDSIEIRVAATRGQAAKVTATFPPAMDAKKSQFESGLNQMLGGFFQSYWPLFATALAPEAREVFAVDARPGGGYTLRNSQGNMNVFEEISADYVPSGFRVESPQMKMSAQLHLAPSEKPIPGDLRRIISADLSQEMGTSTMNVTIGTDYQDVDGFAIPHHVSFDVGGVISVKMAFSDCSVTKKAAN